MTDDAEPRQGPDRAPRRTLTDARELRALAHPVRVGLLELLIREGPMTATEAGEQLGESAANCSFHLRTLARYGFVEEAPGGRGRQRPWRAVHRGLTLEEGPKSPEIDLAAGELLTLLLRREVDRLRHWMGARNDDAEAWRTAGFSGTHLLYLTAGEFDELERDLEAVLDRYADRSPAEGAPPPAGTRPVSVVAYGYPLPPTASGR